MKKFILLIIFILFAIPNLCLAVNEDVLSFSSVRVTNLSEQGGVNYLDILFYWGAENSSTADKPIDLTATTSELLYQTSPKLTGSYSTVNDGTSSSRNIWTNTADAILDRDEGRVGFWVETGSSISNYTYFQAYYSSSDFISFKTVSAAYIQVDYVGNSITQGGFKADEVYANNSYFFEISWSDTTNNIRVFKDGVEITLSSDTITDEITDNTANGIILIGGRNAGVESPLDASYDQVIISNDPNRDLYSLRFVTNFN